MKRLHPVDFTLVFVLAALFTVLSIQASLHSGVLSVPPTYDDIEYFNDAAGRLTLLYNDGITSMLRDFITHPPHSPFSTGIALIGFALFGFHPWAAYLVNGIWVFVLLLGLRAALLEQPPLVYSAVALAALSWPLPGYLVLEGRPDVICGFLIAAGCLFILSEPWIEASRQRIFNAALIAGLALWSKPAMILVTVFLYGAACIFATAADYIENRNKPLSFRALIRPTLNFSLTAFVISLPYYFFAWRQTFDYIYVNYAGSEKSIWVTATATSRFEGAIYYVLGTGGQRTMGAWFSVTLILILFLGALKYRQVLANHIRLAAVAAWCVVTYLAVTIPAVKTPYLGIVVSFAALLIFLAALKSLLSTLSGLADKRLSRFLTYGACAGLVTLAATLFHWHVYYYTGGAPAISGGGAMRAQRVALVDQMTDALEVPPPQSALVYIPTATPYLNASTLQFAFYQKQVFNVTLGDRSTSSSMQDQLAALAAATEVILPDAGDPELVPYLPATLLVAPLTNIVTHDPNMELKATFETADGLHHFRIYQRRPPFDGVVAVSGFLPLEGPYPQWNLPQLRWAIGAQAHLAPGIVQPHSLFLQGRTPFADQLITVSIDGTPLGLCQLPKDGATGQCTFALPANFSGKDIALQFSHPGPASQGQRSVLFQEIVLK